MRADRNLSSPLLREEGAHLPLVQAEDPTVAAVQLWSPLRDHLVRDVVHASGV
jgi:hypothetical protein